MKHYLVFMLIIGPLNTNVYGKEEHAVKRKLLLDGRLDEVYKISGRWNFAGMRTYHNHNENMPMQYMNFSISLKTEEKTNS